MEEKGGKMTKQLLEKTVRKCESDKINHCDSYCFMDWDNDRIECKYKGHKTRLLVEGFAGYRQTYICLKPRKYEGHNSLCPP